MCQNLCENQTNVYEHFPQITDDCRGLLEKIITCFDYTLTNLSVIEGTRKDVITNDILKCEDISSHEKMSQSLLSFGIPLTFI